MLKHQKNKSAAFVFEPTGIQSRELSRNCRDARSGKSNKTVWFFWKTFNNIQTFEKLGGRFRIFAKEIEEIEKSALS